MMKRLALAALVAIMPALPALAAGGFTFASIDGGDLNLDDWKGRPVLVVNSASRCGYTPQYEGLQALYERYKDRGLVVLAVPSDDFRQELSDEAAVKDFCEVTYGLTIPMTEITHVRGSAAHPFYKWVKDETGFEPRWNFNKVLIGTDGEVVETFGSRTKPLSQTITRLIEAELAG